MNCLKNVCELIDISSREDEEGILEKASTPLPPYLTPNYRVVRKLSHSSAGAIADGEELFDTSADSLEVEFKRMKLESSFEELEPGEFPNTSTRSSYTEILENPESPDEQPEEEDIRNTNSGRFILTATDSQDPNL